MRFIFCILRFQISFAGMLYKHCKQKLKAGADILDKKYLHKLFLYVIKVAVSYNLYSIYEEKKFQR